MSDALFGNAATAKVDALVEELHKTPGWPVDMVRDRAFIAELVGQFPALDLQNELQKYRVWLLDQKPEVAERRVKSRGRLQTIRNWCRDVRTGQATGGSGRGRRRTSTVARSADAFGAESSASLTRW